MMEDDYAVSRGVHGYEELLTKNWCGNIYFGQATTAVPPSVPALQDVVRAATPPVRVLGRGHSFSPIAECGSGTLLSLARLNRVLEFEPPSAGRVGCITIEGGTTYTEIATFLGRRGALRNLPSCPQFTVAGAIATATHGSGVHSPNLSADVRMLEFVKADGSLVRYDRAHSAELLEGSLVHLGCLGVVSRLSLDVVPWYEVSAFRYDDVDLEAAIAQLPTLWEQCDSLSVWTAGLGHGPGAGKCWVMFRHFLPFWDEKLAIPVHTPPESLLAQGGVLMERQINRYCTDPDQPLKFCPTGRGSWVESLTQTFADGRETSMGVVDLQAEFFVPLVHAQAAIRAAQGAVRDWTFSAPHGFEGEPVKGLVDAMEFRQVKGDAAWLSPQPVDSLGIHVSFNGDPLRREEVLRALPTLERALAPFGARAHWGKLAPLTCAPARIEALYGEHLRRFRALCDEHDPTGKFRNSHIRQMLFGEAPPPSRSCL